MVTFTEEDDSEWETVGYRNGAKIHPNFSPDHWNNKIPSCASLVNAMVLACVHEALEDAQPRLDSADKAITTGFDIGITNMTTRE